MSERYTDQDRLGTHHDLQQLVDVVRSLPLCLSVFGEDGVCIESNEANDELWGASLRGLPVEDVRAQIGVIASADTGRQLDADDWPVTRVFATRLPVLHEALALAHADGSSVTLLVSAVPFFDEAGRLIAVVAESQDVTDEREAVRFSSALTVLNHLIHATRDPGEAMALALEHGTSALGAPAGAVELVESGRCRLRSIRGLPESLLGTPGADAAGEVAGLADEREPLSRELRESLGIVSTLTLPLVSRGSAIGRLSFYFDRQRSFRSPARHFCRELSLTLAAALENAQLFEAAVRAEKRAEEELETTKLLLGASRALASWSEPQAALHPLADFLLTAVGHNRVTLLSWDDERATMRVEAAAGVQPLPLGLDVPVADFTPMTRQSLITRAPIIVDVMSVPPERRIYSTTWGMTLVLSVPLSFGKELVGLLTIDDAGVAHDFDEREITIAEGIASQVAAAIMNAKLHRRQSQELANTRLLQDVAIAGASGLDVEGVCEHVIEELRHHLGVKALVHRLDPETAELHLVAAAGYDEDVLGRLRTLPADPSPNIVLAAADHLKALVGEPDGAGGGSGSRWVVLPVRRGEELLGVLSLTFQNRETFPKSEIDVYRGVAATLGNAISNALLFEAQVEAQRKAEDELEISNLLLQAAAALSSSVQIDELADALCELVQKALSIGRVGVILFEEDQRRLRVVAMRAYQAPRLPDVVIAEGDPLMDALDRLRAAGATAVDVNDGDLVGSTAMNTGQELGWITGLWAPMFTAGKLLGFVSADEPWERREFTERDRQVCVAVASEAAVSIDNARRYETQYRIAETLQQALIEIPTAPIGIDHAELYRSADELTSVGGDFYDIFELDDEHIAIAIGDVSGKGLAAASLTSTVRDALRVLSLEGHSPAEVVRQTSALLYRMTPVEMFVTLFFAVLSRVTGSILYVVAAHPAPLVLHRGGEVDALLGGGHLVGAFADVTFEEQRAQLKPDDVLLMYTDGLTDARIGGVLFGTKRIAESLGRNGAAAEDLSTLIGAVCADAEAFSGGILKDDVALLAIRLWSERAR